MRTRSSKSDHKFYELASNDSSSLVSVYVSPTPKSGPRRKGDGSASAGELSLLDPLPSDHPTLTQPTVSGENIRRVPKRSIVLNNQTTRDLQAALGRNKILSLRNSELILALGKKRAENLELKRVVSLNKIDSVKMAHKLRILADKIDNHAINQNAAKDAVMESAQCPICYLPMFVPDTLPECGHTFCQSCLVGWFAELRKSRAKVFSCPTCRKALKFPPFRNRALEGLVETLIEIGLVGSKSVKPIDRVYLPFCPKFQ
ncbi:hypothetical protein B0H16DRAFT_1551636 [Mycena metata]|uniref:RING-type domain-containing protein n=1 Tax=Mycena metata TaxID=1033252 RepID=A0AAD7IT07_9AGAR|nr:hypothetical protein B0H16DRAFT_1551636 [Mycena metata]